MTNAKLKTMTAGKDAKTARAIADRFNAVRADAKAAKEARFISDLHTSAGAVRKS